jgi:hypothetical protein
LLSEKLTSGAETRPLFCFVETSFYTKSRAFAKTGSGITPETFEKRTTYLQAATSRTLLARAISATRPWTTCRCEKRHF